MTSDLTDYHALPDGSGSGSGTSSSSSSSASGDATSTSTTPSQSSASSSPVHAFTPFIGYCFTVNYILGVGVLGMPYAFYEGGYILTIIALIFVTIFALITSIWLVDVAHRARHIVKQQQQLSSPPPLEFNGLVDVFLGARARRIYEIVIFIYMVGALWGYVSVFASSTASHLPISFLNHGSDCDVYKDHSSSCNDLYLFYVALFAAFVLPVSCLDLTEMIWFQIFLSAFRFIALATMMVTSLVSMSSYPNPLLAIEHRVEYTSAPYISDIKAINWNGLSMVIPVAIYGQIFHHSVPGLARPFKNPSRIPFVFTCVLFTTVSMYISLGLIVGLYYGSSAEQTCTLNWAHYNGRADANAEAPGWASFISYLVVLFPPIDVLSAYPLNCITLGNNLVAAFITDPIKLTQRRYIIPFRLISCILPICGAMIVKDLGTVLKYSGCLGVVVAFVFPVLLQRASLIICRTTYGQWFDGIGVVHDHYDVGLHDVPNHGIVNDECERVPLTLAPPIFMRPFVIGTVFLFAIGALLTVIILSAVA